MTKAFAYQIEGVRAIEKFDGVALLADEMGLGKTYQAIRWQTIRKDKTTPCVVVCPAYLKHNWQHEIRHHFKRTSMIISGGCHPQNVPQEIPEIIIINYEILDSWIDWIVDKVDPQCIILDECHYIKNPDTIRTRAVMWLRDVPYKIALSGTPLTNKPSELFSVLHWLLPDDYPNFIEFAQEFCNPKYTRWGWDYSGAKNIPQLHADLKNMCMIRRLKKDVLKDLPDKIISTVPLQIERKREYKQAEQKFLQWVREERGFAAAKRVEGTQHLQHKGFLKRLAAELKMKAVIEWIDSFLEESDEKIVVFGIHKKIIRKLEKRYKNICTYVDGSITHEKRHAAVRRFQSNPNCRMFIGNIDAAGVGLTLTAAPHLVFVELDWISTKHDQAMDRIHRIGQTKTANIYFLVAQNTIEHDMCLQHQKMSNVVSETLDGSTRSATQLFTQLTDTIKKRNRKTCAN